MALRALQNAAATSSSEKTAPGNSLMGLKGRYRVGVRLVAIGTGRVRVRETIYLLLDTVRNLL